MLFEAKILHSRYCHAGQDIMLGLRAGDWVADETLPNREGARNCWTWPKKIHRRDSSQREKLTKRYRQQQEGLLAFTDCYGVLT